MTRLRVGVVGVGHLGKEHARILAGMPEVELAGVADVNTVGRTFFNTPENVFSSHPRVVQLALRFNF